MFFFFFHNFELENVFVKHYAPNHMPDAKGEWSLKENNSELHYGICSKVYQFIYTLVFNYMPIVRILAKGVLQISRSKGCSYTKCLCPNFILQVEFDNNCLSGFKKNCLKLFKYAISRMSKVTLVNRK